MTRFLPIPKLSTKTLNCFWSKVDKSSLNECWPWIGSKIKGYGHIHIGSKSYRATRVSLAIIGKRNNTLEVRHSCNNPECVNPSHLKFGTHEANQHDRILAGTSSKGSKNGSAKLTEVEIPIIRRMAHTTTKMALGRLFDVSPRSIYAILTNRKWSHVVGIATLDEVNIYLQEKLGR